MLAAIRRQANTPAPPKSSLRIMRNALIGFRGVEFGSCDQGGDEGSE
jgi:hypothetical protein